MIDLKPDVLQALESNPALVALIGYDLDGAVKIYESEAPYAEDYPRITYFELTNFDSDYAEDEAIESTVSLQIDVWAKGSTTEIAKEVDQTMKSIGFRRTSSADLYEDDVKVHHKGMRYSTAVESA